MNKEIILSPNSLIKLYADLLESIGPDDSEALEREKERLQQLERSGSIQFENPDQLERVASLSVAVKNSGIKKLK